MQTHGDHVDRRLFEPLARTLSGRDDLVVNVGGSNCRVDVEKGVIELPAVGGVDSSVILAEYPRPLLSELGERVAGLASRYRSGRPASGM